MHEMEGNGMKTKFLNLGLVLSLILGLLLTAYPVKAEVTPWPVDGFWNDPYDPSTFDKMSFGLYGETPYDWTCRWDFGDGTTYTECYVDHAKQYAKDGDYTVSVQVTDTAGLVSTTSRVVSVRTHDVSIARFSVPKSARQGQTRQIIVYVRNSRYLEKVQVELYKNDFVRFGTLIQDIPPRSANRTTAFTFNYTFTSEDALIGKVTFRALAFILNDGGDDWTVYNDVIALPTRVPRLGVVKCYFMVCFRG